MFISHRHLPALAVMLLAAPLAHAHPLADHSLAWQAFVHPFSGADHVFAMLVIGLWAGLAAPARRLLPPLAFMGGLLGGAALGALGVALPALEVALALSVLLLGPLAARDARLPALLCLAACALAGMFHGYAHGVELPAQGAAAACFVLGSALLHALGFAVARQLHVRGHGLALRRALNASALFGVGLLWMA